MDKIIRFKTAKDNMDESDRKAEETHQHILEEIEEGYLEANVSGIITFCNQPFCRITGYSLEELKGYGFPGIRQR